MIWDGAGFHTAKALCVPANVTLVQLPPYSPELNPIENLWHYLKRFYWLKSHYWNNRNDADNDALEEAATTVWRTAVLDQDRLRPCCTTRPVIGRPNTSTLKVASARTKRVRTPT
jgi:hypothetical protein